MKVIILAAGIGKRLGNSGNDKPKCLLEFNGVSLLKRHLDILSGLNVDEILIVYGYRKELIDAEIKGLVLQNPVRTVFNPDYTSGSIVSFWCARELLQSGDDIVLMDADVLYEPSILQSLIETDKENCFLLDRDFETGEEPVKLCVLDNQLVDFRKQIDQDLIFDYQGESVGFFRFSPEMSGKLATRAQYYIDNNKKDEPYEEVIRDLLLSEKDSFAFEDITGLPWIEIDFPEDIERANSNILNNIPA